MAVYKRNYKSYTGPVSSPSTRWMAITRHSIAQAFSSRISLVLFCLALMPMLVAAVIIYVANSETARSLLAMNGGVMAPINNKFFLGLLEMQSWLALFVTAWIGPAMVSPDLTNGALPLFLSRPISRAQYLFGKIMVLGTVLSGVTWIPLMVLFLLQAELASGWLFKNAFIAVAILVGSALWIAFLSLLALAVSAYVRWRIVATGLMVALVFIPSGFGAVISGVLRTRWGFLLNVPYMVTLIWMDLLHLEMNFRGGVPVWAAWMSLVSVCGLCLLILNKRIRARQVVRG